LDKIFLKNYKNILNSVSFGIFTVDKQWRITFFNKVAEEITGLSEKDVLGNYCHDVFKRGLCPGGCYLKEAIKSKKSSSGGEVVILNKFNQAVPISITGSVLKDENGNLIGGIGSFRDRYREVSLEKKLKESYEIGDIVGRDEKMKKIFEMLPSVAESLSSVLILGETGTGKDLIARALHNLSNRSEGPYIKINCAALPEHLLESELFGYIEGAFTDAKKNKPGMFQLAQGGTIFLDEIGDLPIMLQSKILQVLDDKEFFPLGSIKPVKVDVRVVSSTNKDIRGMIENNLFRSDLYYRLNVIEICLPPLRERKTDIPLLIEKFLGDSNLDMNKNIVNVSKRSMQLFLRYTYPGNIRELKNIIENAVVLSEDDIIHHYDLSQVLFEKGSAESKLMGRRVSSQDSLKPLAVSERATILEFLDQCKWDLKEAARLLHIDRSTLWRKMKKYNLSPIS
jgi:PAS domain S-box-containing protein